MYIYKITNLKTKEFYIGKREAWDGRPSLDKYMGSGNIIGVWKRAGYPMVKSILIEVDDKKLLTKLEGVFINHYYNDPLCKNIALGASTVDSTFGGSNYQNTFYNRSKFNDSDKFNQKPKRKAQGRGLAALLYDYDSNGNRLPLGKGLSYSEYSGLKDSSL